MSKRSLSPEGASLGDAPSPPGKRQQTQDPRGHQLSTNEFKALKILADNADDLISALQKLKQCSGSISEGQSQDPTLLAATQDLAGLGDRITPHLKLLAHSRHFDSAIAPSTYQSSLEFGIPSMEYATPWRSSEISSELPPLPKVGVKKLEELAFTHPGFVPGSSPDKQYERLEWLGDAYLELIATVLIDKTFLHLPSGRCSQLRERLIRNTTLAHYFRQYGLESRAKLPKEFLRYQKFPGRGSSADKDLLKTQSDMFEAYVAAIVLSDPVRGLEITTNWLKALWGRDVIEDVQRAEEGKLEVVRDNVELVGQKRTPKEELSSRIVVKGVTLRYEKLGSNKRDKNIQQQLFTVGVYLDGWGEMGKLLGTGSALSVKEAGQKAAIVALQNKTLVSFYEGKKQAFTDAKASVK